MQLTTQFQFTEGFGQFPPGRTYILVGHVKIGYRVAIVHLRKINAVDLILMNRKSFEDAISGGIIKVLDKQAALPPWLCQKNDPSQLLGIHSEQALAKKHSGRIADHVKYIKPICFLWQSLIESTDPILAINLAIRQEAKRQELNINVTRVRAQLLTYLAFGQSDIALLPAYPNCGSATEAKKITDGSALHKRGRPAENGKQSGFNADEPMIKKMLCGYFKHKKEKVRVATIYTKTLDTEFNCKVVRNNKEKIVSIYQPDDLAFPSESQFRYHINIIIGKKKVREGVVGTNYIRRAESASEGAYSDGVAFIGESVQFDGKVVNEYPISFNGSAVLEKMHTVSLKDVASGLTLGIGGGLGAEDTTSHKLMLFCAALDKVKFCSLFGIEIEPYMWRSKGIPEGLLGDRGPGMSAAFTQDAVATMRSFGRSFTGQDKPNVETGHEKTPNIEGRQPVAYAKLNVVQLFKKQIQALIRSNLSTNVDSRLTPEMVSQGVVPNPQGIYDFLAEKGRSMLVDIPFEKAVRDYLTPIEVTLAADGVIYNGLRFRSDALMQSGLPDYAKRNGSIKLDAFALELCLSTLWLEDGAGNLIEIKYSPALMEDVDFIPLCHADSFQYNDALKRLNAEQQEVARAANLIFEQGARMQETLAAERVKPLRVKPGSVSQGATGEAMKATGGTRKSA